jgi:transcriptional regulator with XRE-family HTH domain
MLESGVVTPPRRPVLTPEHRRLAALLRTIRTEQGLTQEQVGERLDRRQGYISKYETAERRLDLIQLRDVAEALGVGLVDMVQRFEAERPRQLTKRKR